MILVDKVCGKRDYYSPDTYVKFQNKFGGDILYITVVKCAMTYDLNLKD